MINDSKYTKHSLKEAGSSSFELGWFPVVCFTSFSEFEFVGEGIFVSTC